MKRPALYDYQVRAISYGIKNPYSILALDPGLGKTRCAIEIREKVGGNCLVICPSYLITNWIVQIKKWAGERIVTAITKGKEIYDLVDSDYAIISYDLAQKAPYFFEWADMVMLDEPQNYIKTMPIKRTQFIHKQVFENSVPRMHLLTGTPIKNRVKEFYSLLALCFYNPNIADPSFLNSYPSEIDFADHFSFRHQYQIEVSGKFVTVLKWKGVRNVKELKQHLKKKYIRIRDDVLGLDAVIFKPILLSDVADPALLAAFNEYYSAEEKQSVKSDLKAEAALKKAPFTVKYVQDLLEEVDSVVIFTDHIESCKEIAAAFGVAPITGLMSSTRRGKLADEFQNGDGRVIVATIGSLSVGKDLFKSCHMVFNDYPWVPGDLKQAIKRIHRLGQNRRCTVHKIMGSPQDEYITETIEEKIQDIDKVT